MIKFQNQALLNGPELLKMDLKNYLFQKMNLPESEPASTWHIELAMIFCGQCIPMQRD